VTNASNEAKKYQKRSTAKNLRTGSQVSNGSMVERQGISATLNVAAFDLGKLGKSAADRQIGRDRLDHN
jgi:hypothetical protein